MGSGESRVNVSFQFLLLHYLLLYNICISTSSLWSTSCRCAVDGALYKFPLLLTARSKLSHKTVSTNHKFGRETRTEAEFVIFMAHALLEKGPTSWAKTVLRGLVPLTRMILAVLTARRLLSIDQPVPASPRPSNG